MEKPVLEHLGIIMDGNRRWAKKHGLPTFFGHKKGYEKVLHVGDWCIERGIKVLTVFAFSTENWNRSKKEVDYLMNLLRTGLKKDVAEMHRKGIKVQFIGRLHELPADLRKVCDECVELTSKNTKGILNIALNYGGQPEIVDAVNKIIRDKVKKVTQESFVDYLYDPKMPPADLIIRTSGEQRISGFLLWHASYSEFYFTKTFWPDFSEHDLDHALADYQARQRRHGK